jgi:hypothetical protein
MVFCLIGYIENEKVFVGNWLNETVSSARISVKGKDGGFHPFETMKGFGNRLGTF